jgi:ribosome biogenesis protein Nip4
MRQTGRTSRIINFVVDQLFSVGRCIATDHTVFEFDKLPMKNLDFFIRKVEERILISSNGEMKVSSKVIRVDDVYMVDFKLSINKS